MEKEKPIVLVLMPFRKDFNDIYEFGIEQAVTRAGARCVRVDKQIFQQNILQQVYDQISEADIIVAEMTGQNPNVFYETGYAYALNKRVIPIVKDEQDIPFDLKHYQHIIYQGSITELSKELEKSVRFYIDNPVAAPDGDGRLPLIKVSPSLIDKQVRTIPREWCSRSLYLGLTGAQNWLSVVSNSNSYKADYFKDVVASMLDEEDEDFLSDVKVRAMVSLGPGDGETDKQLCTHLNKGTRVEYVPVDMNPFLLTTSICKVGALARTQVGIVCDFEEELVPFLKDALQVHSGGPYLFSMLGYTVGNLDRREGKFFSDMKGLMGEGDYMLLDYLAVDMQWDYEKYSKSWQDEWDDEMRKLVCDAVAKRNGEDGKQVFASFKERFSFRRGKSDVPGSYATFIRDEKTQALVTNIRRYQKLGDWLRKTFKFEVVHERTNIEADHAGSGYILIKKGGTTAGGTTAYPVKQT